MFIAIIYCHKYQLCMQREILLVVVAWIAKTNLLPIHCQFEWTDSQCIVMHHTASVKSGQFRSTEDVVVEVH